MMKRCSSWTVWLPNSSVSNLWPVRILSSIKYSPYVMPSLCSTMLIPSWGSLYDETKQNLNIFYLFHGKYQYVMTPVIAFFHKYFCQITISECLDCTHSLNLCSSKILNKMLDSWMEFVSFNARMMSPYLHYTLSLIEYKTVSVPYNWFTITTHLNWFTKLHLHLINFENLTEICYNLHIS